MSESDTANRLDDESMKKKETFFRHLKIENTPEVFAAYAEIKVINAHVEKARSVKN
jgi:hypothetical protein